MKKNDTNTNKHGIFSNIIYALKKIWEWDRIYILCVFFLIPIGVIISILELYFPKVLMDSLKNVTGLYNIITLICSYFFTLFIMNLLRMICDSKRSSRKYSFSYRYQNALWEKYMRTDFVNIESPTENVKFQNAMNDANSYCSPELILQSLFDLSKNMLGIITYGTIIVTVSPWIVVFLFVSAIITYFIGRWLRSYSEKHKDQLASLDRKIVYLSTVSTNFDYAKDIRIFNLSQWISEMFARLYKEKISWQKKTNIRSFFGLFCNAILTLIRDGIAYAVLVSMLLNCELEIGDFVFLFGLITGFSSWLNGLSGKINEVMERGIKIGYYREYFEIGDRFNHGIGCKLPSKSELPVEITFENVSYKYPSASMDSYALKNINLTISPGEKIAIVGENGSGKTTLVKLLCGLYYPTDGKILINGRNVVEHNIDEYYSMFSVVFQDIYILPITIEEFVSSCEDIINKEKVEDVIRKAGLEKKISSLRNGTKTHLVKGVFDDSIELSGGEKQKLMLARALYKDAPIVVLDEPTAAFDPIAESEIYLRYNEFTQGKTSIFISHRLASTRFCDRIIYVENGEIVETGSHDELLNRGGKYYKMFELQRQYYKEDDTI